MIDVFLGVDALVGGSKKWTKIKTHCATFFPQFSLFLCDNYKCSEQSLCYNIVPTMKSKFICTLRDSSGELKAPAPIPVTNISNMLIKLKVGFRMYSILLSAHTSSRTIRREKWNPRVRAEFNLIIEMVAFPRRKLEWKVVTIMTVRDQLVAHR